MRGTRRVPQAPRMEPASGPSTRRRHRARCTRVPHRAHPARALPKRRLPSWRCSPTSSFRTWHLPTSESGLPLFDGCIVLPGADAPALRIRPRGPSPGVTASNHQSAALVWSPVWQWRRQSREGVQSRQGRRRCCVHRGAASSKSLGSSGWTKGAASAGADSRRPGGLARSRWGEHRACCSVDRVARERPGPSLEVEAGTWPGRP